MLLKHIERWMEDTKMIYKLFELFYTFIKDVNKNPSTQEDNREAKMLRREIESKQSPHIL